MHGNKKSTIPERITPPAREEEGICFMSQIPLESLRHVIEALKRYEREVEQSKLKPSTKRTYILHANNFVRWLKGDFTPGGTIGQGQGRPYNYWR